MRRSLVVSLALLAIVRSPVVAQTCQGLASFSTGKMQVAANAQFPEGAKIWAGSVSYGMPSGAFVGADVSNTSINDDGGSSLGFGAHAGYQMKLGRTGKVNLCPVARFALGMGPDDEAANLNSSSTDLHFGFALGTEMGASQQMRILPTAGLGLQYSKAKEEITSGPGAGTTELSETYALARLGVGLVVNQQISIRPTVDIPLGRDVSNDPTFGITVGYNFGSGHSAPRRR
jgi:outer membrane protein with beta-barrel domain